MFMLHWLCALRAQLRTGHGDSMGAFGNAHQERTRLLVNGQASALSAVFPNAPYMTWGS